MPRKHVHDSFFILFLSHAATKKKAEQQKTVAIFSQRVADDQRKKTCNFKEYKIVTKD